MRKIGVNDQLRCKWCGWVPTSTECITYFFHKKLYKSRWLCPTCHRWLRFRWFKPKIGGLKHVNLLPYCVRSTFRTYHIEAGKVV